MSEQIDHLWRAECRGCGKIHDVADSLLRQTYPDLGTDFDAGEVLCRCPGCEKIIMLYRTEAAVLDFSAWNYEVPPGFCQECGIQHAEALPHDPTTMVFIMNFRRKCIEVGVEPRWPSWRDAMRHCAPAVRAGWIDALARKGVNNLDAPTT